jgi:hypothetical protein
MNGAVYFAMAISYECKMFMKSTTGVNLRNIFSLSIKKETKLARVSDACQACLC